MDLANVQAVNPSHVGSNTRSTRSVMRQKRETLKSINDEIVQLVQKKRRLEKDLGATYNHDILPNEILGQIFILVAQNHGPVVFPIYNTNFPPQLTITHVCSHWRQVALRTSELWNNTCLDFRVESEMGSHNLLLLHGRWLLRARKFPVTLSVHFREPSFGVSNTLQVILFPLKVKRLHLDLKYGKFVELSALPETILSDSATLELCLSLYQSDLDINMNIPNHLITRIRSITLYGSTFDVWLDKLSPSFPWGQLRSMSVPNIPITNLHPVVDVLRQMRMLQALHLKVAKECRVQDALEDVAMPSLLDFNLQVSLHGHNGEVLDKILCSFTCHSLTKFSLVTYTHWTSSTFEVLGRRYNMQRLQEVHFSGSMVLPVSVVLQKAPLLCKLSVISGAILDDQAIMGISVGTLGRCLRRLELDIKCDISEVLRMVEARKQTVDGLIENGCTWEEEITVLTDVEISIDEDDSQYRETVNALKKAGIIITFV